MNNPEISAPTSRLRIEPRWTDLDPVGHVNNSVFLVYAEESRTRLLQAAVPGAWEAIVVVRNAIDYHSSIEGTDTLEVTTAVTDVGTSSLATVSEIATTDGRSCGTVSTVQVVLRSDRTGSRPWADTERTALAVWISNGANSGSSDHPKSN